MKIERICVNHFLGAAAVDVRTPSPVILFAGKNGAGKSSVRDSVALALTGDLGRVDKKKDSPALIHAGADLAVCEVTTGDGEVLSASINAAGKVTSNAGDPGVLAYVLDAQRFAKLDATERRAFLFGLMDLRTDGPAVVERLLARGLDKAKVERVAPLLRAGFEPAHKDAKAQALQAKGAWRATTGEAYGSEKAKSWKAPVPAFDAAAAQALWADLQQLEEAILGHQRTIGAQQAEQQRRAGLSTKLAGLQGLADKVERIRTKLATDEAELRRVISETEQALMKAGSGKRYGLIHDLARAVDYLLSYANLEAPTAEDVDAQAALQAYEAQHGALSATGGDPAEAARIPALEQARAVVARAIENDKRDLDAAQRASGEAEAIRKELAAPWSSTVLSFAQREVETLKERRAELVKQQDAHKAQAAAAAAAEKRTKDAAQHTADVAAWDAIGDALAPDGIPGEILAAALTPLNERLAQSAEDTGWAAVCVHEDMRITANLREYRLLSASERWRCDAMLAEAIAHLSGARLLVLDEADILDLPGRAQLLTWLDVLASNGEIDTALVFATLKALPAGLPESIATHWVENGTCGQIAEAA